ncbi:MAG: hypothetical protein HY866_18350 [Chloroflexi bacterium]|nr:hypothetical protein [Chloroflexota bacterium]
MQLYEPGFLQQARQKLGVTDMWVTYSWGFADSTEQPDRDYMVGRLDHFHRHDIAAHAYVQGLNVVAGEFAGSDIFCRDTKGNMLRYSKGRGLTCPNNPAARQIILDRVAAACKHEFSGVFVDNILFGLPPFFVRRDYTSFFGCACPHCQRAFRDHFGYDLPLRGISGEKQLVDYLEFRCQSVAALVAELSQVARGSGKQFGVNLYDPLWHSPEIYFGYHLAQIAPLLDYYLIENHALGKNGGIDNRHLTPLIDSTPRKPVFVVSYRYGIGYDAAYNQRELDTIWSDAHWLGYAPCMKATEFVTRGVWHALDLDHLDAPALHPLAHAARISDALPLRCSLPAERPLIHWGSRYYARLIQLSFEHKWLARLLVRSRLVVILMRMYRKYNLDVLDALALPDSPGWV